MSDAPTSTQHSPAPPRPRRRGGRLVLVILGVLLALLVAAELVARLYLGLGNPPLSVADPEVEYLFKPSQDVRRFGNRVKYNAYSMRSDDFPPTKTDPRELRVMVFGDSVVNGGAQTDQSQIATTLLQERLRAELNRPVIVGNISAGSWGPVNMLAYARKFGLFDADLVLLVLSSHDTFDVPTIPFTPVVGVQPTYPDRKPLLAVQELLMRYLLPRLQGPVADASVPEDRPSEQKDIDWSLTAMEELVSLGQSSGARVIVAQYWERRELIGGPSPGLALIASAARKSGADVVDLGPALREALFRGEDPFRDTIHPNAAGQRVLADALFPEVLRRVMDVSDVSENIGATSPAAPAGIGQ